MKLKVFFDANVLLDLLLDRGKEVFYIKEIFKKIENEAIIGCLSLSILHIISYWLVKSWGPMKAKKAISILLEDLEVLEGDKHTVLQALSIDMNDIEDAIQYTIAFKHKVDYIISNDKEFIRNPSLKISVISPKDFISKA